MTNQKKTEFSIFDRYANEYDLITDARARRPHHAREVEAIVRAINPDSVLDAGCALGLTSELFARLGVRTVGLDRSTAMLREARKRYARSSLPLTFKSGSFEKLPRGLDGKFDLVVCLANSLSGVGTNTNLKRALRGFHRLLKPGGTFILQSLNLVAISDATIYPVKATSHGKIVYQRFAERRGKLFFLYITRLDRSTHPLRLEVFRHQFDSFTPAVILASLKEAGFVCPRKFADLFFSKPFLRSSRDLVVRVTKK